MEEDQEKPAIAPPVFVFQKDKAQKRPAEGSSAEDGEDSDREDSSYCPPVKRERTSSFNQFPPSNTVSKNNVFMPSSLCQSPTGSSSDSEPEEKTVVFRLKPPTLIHGQAPSTGVPSHKPKEEHRSVLRPALLQPPPAKTLSHTGLNSGTNGVNRSSAPPVSRGNTDNHDDGSAESADASREDDERDEGRKTGERKERRDEWDERDESRKTGEWKERRDEWDERDERDEGRKTGERKERRDPPVESTFVFGQNVRDRAKVEDSSESSSEDIKEKRRRLVESPAGETNYFLQYISTPSSQASDNNSSDTSSKFVFGQNMSDRVLSPPAEGSTDPPVPQSSQAASQDDSSEKGPVGAAGSLEASAAAYTKATAKRCLLEKVEVITGEEAESNVLQIQCKLFVFDKLAQSWVERGRGLLRLNDMASTEDTWPPGSLQSRLVMRTQGSLRLILNTKLWAQMQTDKASEKSLRITAMDTEDQGLKVFLVAASSKDTGQLYAALHHRILALRSRSEQEPEPRPLPPTGHAPQSNEDDSDEDQTRNHAPPGAAATGSAHSATETGFPPSGGPSQGSEPQPGCSGSGGS